MVGGIERARGRPANTLSNSAAWRSPAFTTVRGLREHEHADAGERRRTGVNETKTETTAGATLDRFVSERDLNRSPISSVAAPILAELLTSGFW